MAGTKRSAQRELLLEILRGTKTHPDADWLYQRARERMPKISLGTVYRNLVHLADEGEIKRLDLPGKAEHFDGDTREHYHFVCESCGRIIDVSAEYDGEINAKASGAGEVTGHSITFFGICRVCSDGK